jgi:hypothetical protein
MSEESSASVNTETAATCNSTEEHWYSVCFDYFSTGVNKSAIEWFQQLDNTSNTNNDNGLTGEQIDFYKQCGIFFFASQDDWYKFDRIKNRARSAVHTAMGEARLATILAEIHNTAEEFASAPRTNAAIMSDLNRFLALPGMPAAAVVWTLLDHVCLWIHR